MDSRKTPGYLLIFSVLLLFAGTIHAEQSKDLGEYVVHYNALTTDFLTPQVAKLYNIKRSKNRAMLNVTVLKKHMGLASLPATAVISANATNLNNQVKQMNMREITDGGAIYYIGEVPVSHQEVLDFKIEVTTDDGLTRPINFRQRFFTK